MRAVWAGARLAPSITLEEPLELPSPRRLVKIKDSGWASDDTKIYEIDKRGKHTHTHTQPVVVSLFC